MGKVTGIEWCDHTFNAWIGCKEVSPGCANCYARTLMQDRLKRARWGDHERVRTVDSTWNQVFRWDREAAAAGVIRRVFVNSLSDVFEDRPELIAWRRDLFRDVIDRCRNLVFLLLTKRPYNIACLWPDESHRDNVWIGTTIENRQQATTRLPELTKTFPLAPIHFLSMEPLLERVTIGLQGIVSKDILAGYTNYSELIDWVIVGGESGDEARPMDPAWVRAIRDECAAAEVPFFFKQWGTYLPVTVEDDLGFSFGRAYNHPLGGRSAAIIRKQENGRQEWAPIEPGDRWNGGVAYNTNEFGIKVKKQPAELKCLLDGKTHHNWPATAADTAA
ncbi:MAG: DUF5131 family protein [Verrucomicrobiae bacterium]|nr:DUF5131 family protein [Verrucomicrobiae bacterium]